ncbi:1,4-alpha-glucan branching enzyme GlgB [Streptomyces cyaneofuscatus]
MWELFLPGIGEGALYKYDISRPDGSHTVRADPLARRTEVPPATSSVVTPRTRVARRGLAGRTGPTARTRGPVLRLRGPPASWRPGLTYRQLADQLPSYVKDLGFTHVELMPVSEHPFGGSWGYQVTGFYAPTARLGTPDDFRYLVDRLHQAGIGVLMDWVPAHFPRDDWALAEFDGRPLYEHADPLRAAHPDWGTLEFDFGRRRCATSWSPTPCTGARSSTSTGCGWTRSPRCSTWTTRASRASGRPTSTGAGRTWTRWRSSRR